MTLKQPKEVRIESILQSAIQEFIEKGYEGASIDAIAKRAGVSKGGFYHHFPNKEVLLMEVNNKLMEPVMTMIEEALANPSPTEGLRAYAKAYVTYWSSRQMEISFSLLSMAKAFQSQVLMGYFSEYVEQMKQFFVGLFVRAIELKELSIEDPEAYGISMMGALDGIAYYAIAQKSEDVEQLIDRMGELWFRKG